jgi:hypothetical protein
MSMIKSIRLLIRLLLLAVAAGCFTAACRFFDAAMPYAGVISGNPHPSETAKIMGLKLMGYAWTWFIVGLVCLSILVATLFIKARADRSSGE